MLYDYFIIYLYINLDLDYFLSGASFIIHYNLTKEVHFLSFQLGISHFFFLFSSKMFGWGERRKTGGEKVKRKEE